MQNINPIRICIKAILIFAVANFTFAFLNPSLGDLTFYNRLFPGRLRFPFSNNPTDVSVDNLDVLFASHAISVPKATNEYRVVILGDSSVWGDFLSPDQTISEKLNFLRLTCNKKNIHVYNLGYPHSSLIKDLLILDSSIRYQPDMILWMVTLDTLPQKQRNPFLDVNHDRVVSLVQKYKIDYNISAYQEVGSFWDRTLFGRRSDLMSYFILQVHSFYWSGAFHPADPPSSYGMVSNAPKINGTSMRYDNNAELSLDKMYLRVGVAYKISGNIPVVIVNEPMFIATGQNSGILYNSLYARRGYDQYRQSLALMASGKHWNYLDLWNAIPADNFLDTPLHLSSDGENLLAKLISPVISASCH